MATDSTSQPAPSEPVISIRNVTKSYSIWDNTSGRLIALCKRIFGLSSPAKDSERFTAVQTIDLDIAQGECLGIIGRNGAGKSTLLQMIAGTLQPTEGTITVHGRVAALLELGSGFNPDFTGRENVYLNAAILGLTKSEINAQFESILYYSGIEEFIDRPVRTYSSGMTLRLAFAVCVHVNADILIIDEALAVGDARFQFKCHATLEQMLKEGRTIIFVSHDTNAVKRMCRTAILLERGEVLLKGSPNDVTNIYTKLITSPHGVAAIRDDLLALQERGATEDPSSHIDHIQTSASLANGLSSSMALGSNLLLEERSHQQISDKEYSYGGETGKITAVLLTDSHNKSRLSFQTGAPIRVHITCQAVSDVPEPIYALTLKDIRGQEIYGTNTYFQNHTNPTVAAGSEINVVFDLQLNVLPGVYFISLGWVRLENGEVEVIHRRYDVLRFDVLPSDKSFGIAWCPTVIQVNAPSFGAS